MTVQQSAAVRNGRLDSDETVIGTAPKLLLVAGAQAASCAVATSNGPTGNGTVVATLALPSDWSSAASAGVKSKLGTWEDTSADADGTIGHYELWDTALTTCHEQGSVTNTGGGGDLTVQNVIVKAGQDITITAWSKTAAGA